VIVSGQSCASKEVHFFDVNFIGMRKRGPAVACVISLCFGIGVLDASAARQRAQQKGSQEINQPAQEAAPPRLEEPAQALSPQKRSIGHATPHLNRSG
jgi:hypothetical protein